MTFVQTYDAVIRAFRWPIIANAILTATALPVILMTRIIPPEALAEWTWLTAGLSGTLFILAVPDMRNQRAVIAFNKIAREDREENGYGSQWSKPVGQDRLASALGKVMFVEYAILMFANRALAVQLFAALFGLVCVLIASMKYDPAISEKLVADGATPPTGLPDAQTMAPVWVFAGIVGICVAAGIAIACFAFGLTFYYHFGPHYGEPVSAPIMGTVLGGLALAFALLALRGWLRLRKRALKQ